MTCKKSINNTKTRCSWCNTNNSNYVSYHDNEWGKLNTSDSYLFEMLLLETFQAGLSWECILNKREAFRDAFDNFDFYKIASYKSCKVLELLNNKDIVRNKLKINSAITNARIFINIKNEYKSFYNYLKTYTLGKIYYEQGKTSSELSDAISKDLKKRGMKFVGTTIIYSYLQAIGIINSHEQKCFLYKIKQN